MELRQVVIIGSGPAGLTAGIYAARANLNPLIIGGKNPGGQLMGTTDVENWPGATSILGPKLMMDMKAHAQHFGCQFLDDTVTAIDCSTRPFLITTNRKQLQAQTVIIATGAVPKRLGCPGEDQYWGKGVTTCAVCDGAFYRNKKVIIIGGGDTAMEDASFMTKFTDQITIIQNMDRLTASIPMQRRILDNPAIKIHYSNAVQEIVGNGTHVTGTIIQNNATGKKQTLDADGIFIAVGLTPNTSIFKGQLELDKYGYVIPKQHTMTSIEGIFACGDVTDYRYRQAITSAGSGCMAALDVERFLAANSKKD